MSKSSWKPLYIDIFETESNSDLNKKLNLNLNLKNSSTELNKILSSDSFDKNKLKNFSLRKNTITKEHLGLAVRIYNGMKFYDITITENMINQKFGEFSPTRKFPLHKKKKK